MKSLLSIIKSRHLGFQDFFSVFLSLYPSICCSDRRLRDWHYEEAMCCHSRGKRKHKWLLQPLVTVSVHLVLKHVSPSPAVNSSSNLILSLLPHSFWHATHNLVFFPQCLSLKNGRRASSLAWESPRKPVAIFRTINWQPINVKLGLTGAMAPQALNALLIFPTMKLSGCQEIMS